MPNNLPTDVEIPESLGFTAEQRAWVLSEFQQAMKDGVAKLDIAVKTMRGLTAHEPTWRFTLPGGVIANVTFSEPPSPGQIAAFTKAFAAMAEAYGEVAEKSS